MNHSLPGSSVHGIHQVRTLEWVAISSSRVPSQPRDRTRVSFISCIGRRVLCPWHHLRSQRHCEQKPASTIVQISPTIYLLIDVSLTCYCENHEPTQTCLDHENVVRYLRVCWMLIASARVPQPHRLLLQAENKGVGFRGTADEKLLVRGIHSDTHRPAWPCPDSSIQAWTPKGTPRHPGLLQL